MKNSIYFLLFITQIAFGRDICHSLFRKNTHGLYVDDLKKIDKINKIEDWSRRVRVLAYKNDPYAPEIERRAREAFERIEVKLVQGESLEAVGWYRGLYHRVEGSALILERYGKLADALRVAQETGVRDYQAFFRQQGVVDVLAVEYASKLNRSKDLVSVRRDVEKFIKKHYFILGKNFDEYNFIRKQFVQLESSAHCSLKCKDALAEFNASVGIYTDSRRLLFAPLLDGQTKFELQDIRNLFNSHPDAVLIARKKEFLAQGFGVLRKHLGNINLLDRMFVHLSSLDVVQRSRFVRAFKTIFDKEYEQLHALAINRIAYSDQEIAKKFVLMEEQIKSMDPERFWINFSRQHESQISKTWKELLDHAQKEHPQVYERMQLAQKIGEYLGRRGSEFLRKWGRLITVGALGYGVITYVAYDIELDQESIDGDDEGHDGQVVIPRIINDPLKDTSSDAKTSDEEAENETLEYLSDTDEELMQFFRDLLKLDELSAG